MNEPNTPKKRLTARERGYDTAWEKFSKDFLSKHPHCSICGALATLTGHTQEANELRAKTGTNVLIDRLYMPRCRSCNRLEKTRLFF